MITISKEIFIDENNPFIPLQGISGGNYDVVVVLQIRKKVKRRRAGFSRANFVLSADFNEPLDDFKEYMQ